MKILHFTLGPVQSFVEQARRTRDLWAGSFLLSYLSGQAMKAVLDAGGRIDFPSVADENGVIHEDLLRAILNPPHNSPGIGSLPNRFKATVPQDFDPDGCRRAVQGRWEAIAHEVWRNYVAEIAGRGNDTEAIWAEQVARFWEMACVCDADPEDKSDNAWLDRRKNWRTHHPPQQGGDHCTLMGEWTELSGYVRAREREKQDDFWRALREQRQLGTFDLGFTERLCAIALIKRLYPQIARETIGWELDVQHWPSTPYMAAVPWLERAQDTHVARDYTDAVDRARLDWAYSETRTDLACLQDSGRLANLGGDFLHSAALENTANLPELSTDQRRTFQQCLERVNGEVGRPSPFYALLLMDGDHLGKLLQDSDEAEVSHALSGFTDKVDETVRDCCGKTIYAGGDDVLALLPLDRAIDAACQLRQSYLEAFAASSVAEAKATISAAIVFAHYNLSLRAVLDEAHHQLDDVAKAQNGRGSVAIAVLGGSGRTVQWVSTWEDEDTGHLIPERFQTLGQRFADSQLSSQFIYDVRRRLEPLLDDRQRLTTRTLDPKPLLWAEYDKNREAHLDKADADALIDDLVRVCRRRWRDGHTGAVHGDRASLAIDGALLARFLAQQGVRDARVSA
ncbi:MAG: type III-B CRISPR-associated protein Cas10/Cmr2 [Salinibacter sp.]